jgi:gliding motility-associated lipoprotein GldH
MRSLLILLFSLCLFACDNDSFYTKSYTFKNNTWGRNVKPSFIVDIKDTSQLYDFIVTLRTTTSYKYNNLWIFLNTIPPNGSPVREPYEIKTCYPNGSWIGKKTGTIVEHTLIFNRRKVPYKGKYRFSFEQGVTNKFIGDVLDISFEINQLKQ